MPHVAERPNVTNSDLVLVYVVPDFFVQFFFCGSNGGSFDLLINTFQHKFVVLPRLEVVPAFIPSAGNAVGTVNFPVFLVGKRRVRPVDGRVIRCCRVVGIKSVVCPVHIIDSRFQTATGRQNGAL